MHYNSDIFRDEATDDLNTEYKPIEFVTDVGLPTTLSRFLTNRFDVRHFVIQK